MKAEPVANNNLPSQNDGDAETALLSGKNLIVLSVVWKDAEIQPRVSSGFKSVTVRFVPSLEKNQLETLSSRPETFCSRSRTRGPFLIAVILFPSPSFVDDQLQILKRSVSGMNIYPSIRTIAFILFLDYQLFELLITFVSDDRIVVEHIIERLILLFLDLLGLLDLLLL